MRRCGILVLALLSAVFGCDSGTAGPTAGLDAVPLVLAAGNTRVDPDPGDAGVPPVDLARLGIGKVVAVYDLTTPAGQPFSFDLLTRSATNRGAVRISLAHAADAGLVPGGVGSIAEVGIVPSAAGVTRRGEWLDARGDGFARMTLGGSIERDQVLAIEVEEEEGERIHVLVKLSIGPESEISLDSSTRGTYPDVLVEQTIYSSNSWRFGLPTVAVSGDRSSVVVYEGDVADPNRFERYELRLQHDAESGAVTGGGEPEPSPDLGNWRDHEVAALFNVLALARSGVEEVTLRLSFDRGASFAQTEIFGSAIGSGTGGQARLVQIAMALDYSLALIFWRTSPTGASDLVLVEGRPAAFDASNSPTAFTFDPERSIYRSGVPLTPVLMGATWSGGGDLVIGYGFSRFESDPVDRTWTSTTQFRCAVRPFGGVLRDTLVEESVIVGKDPSVAVTGSGAGLRIFYAYEGARGVRLRTSDDGGVSFSGPIAIGDSSAHMPSVFARPGGGAVKVDVLYLADQGRGQELNLRHWDDFDAGTAEDYRLTTAVMEDAASLPPDTPVPGVPSPPGAPGVPGAFDAIAPPDVGLRVTQIAWFGYDAVLDGDEIVVVYDEETYFAWILFGGPDIAFDAAGPLGPTADGAAGEFMPVEPPPLAPGLTEPVPAPDPDHMHQLKLLRFG